MNTLSQQQITQTLTTLHQKAAADHAARFRRKEAAAQSGEPFNRSWSTAYMAVTPNEGAFLHFMAKATKARKIVEFGCSFGISTIYLAAAAKDNGGTVLTTDIEPTKVEGTKSNLAAAGLTDCVEVRLGNALQTLASVEGPVDFLFLDGAKDLYLPVLELLLPQLGKGAVVIADNADHKEAASFVAYVNNKKELFTPIEMFDKRVLAACYQ